MKLCYSAEVRRMDALAAEKFNIPGIVLMENAALACVRELENFKSAVIICGRGNNGGDGLAIARQLIANGREVQVYLAAGKDYSGDALVNYNILKSMGVPMHDARDTAGLAADISAADCTVDAIFGTGFHGGVESPAKEIIEAVNRFSKYTLSVDIPSGINADSGEVETVCIHADKTVTFAAAKAGLFLYPAAGYTGEIVCAPISMPAAVYDEVGVHMQTSEAEHMKKIMPRRRANSQKGDYGKILVIGGKRGMAGAVIMACRSAFKMGAGIVTACVPHEINDIVQASCINGMTAPADFAKPSEVTEKMQGYDAVLFGCGIGRGEEVPPLLEAVLTVARVPVVLDADGLFALAKNPQLLKKCTVPVILTPHSMEMARLIGKDVAFVEKNRLAVCREFVSRYNVTLVLKGKHSIITAPDGRQTINTTGNSGMATAGSGDVLAGMTAALAAVCENVYSAAELAVYTHGRAGDYAPERLCEYSMTAPDIIEAIPHILPVEKSENL